MNVVYDAGVLVGADRSDRVTWADHRARLDLGLAPVTTAPVVAQVSRSGRQAQLRRFLRGCVVVPFEPHQAHVVGALLGEAGSSDVTDGHVVAVAASVGATVLTADLGDLTRLSGCLGTPVPVVRI
ncbi:MAG: twitching motility protein PilT [Actinomycetota bacterium]|nr:twitching motility protein PilT [Actinomycetota bacterium]